jgi:osmoprotectant transport system permease protein
VVPQTVIESGRGMGMGRFQIFHMIEVPIAAPVVLTGIRVSAVQAIGNTAVAALIGAGGLGWFVFQGLGQAANDLIILGVIPTVVLALVVDRVFNVLRTFLPKSIGEIE